MVPQEAQVILNDEHDAFRWVSFEEANAILSFPRQRRVLDVVRDEFVDRIPNPHLKIMIE